MYIRTRVVAAVYRLSIGALSIFTTWLFFHIFGNEAWRLLPTWVMLVASLYYICSVLVLLLSKHRNSGRTLCPTLQGGLVISGLSLAIFRLIFEFSDVDVIGLEGVGMILAIYVLPTLFLLDWIIFTKKGRWRVVDPFYWVSPFICYAMWILISAEFMHSDDLFRYPYGFLNFYIIGIDVMLSWFALIVTIIVVLGYICVVIDFAMSGKLAKHIVLPHIKTIVVEEEVENGNAREVAIGSAKVTKQDKDTVAPQKEVARASSRARTNDTSPSKTSSKAQDSKSSTNSGSVVSDTKKPSNKADTNSVAKGKKAKKQPIALLEAQARSVKKPVSGQSNTNKGNKATTKNSSTSNKKTS